MPFNLYHWSPKSRRQSILKLGLVPGKLSVDKTWRPPYICLSSSPYSAWLLSPFMNGLGFDGEAPVTEDWDLWMTYSSKVKNLRQRKDYPCEYRTRYRVYKRDLWFVGSRAFSGVNRSPLGNVSSSV
jgi:hypothetical protein